MTDLDTATYVATIHAPDGGWGDDDHDTIAAAIDEYGLTCMQVDDGGVWQMRTPINKKSISVEGAREGGASRFGFKRITSLGTCAPAASGNTPAAVETTTEAERAPAHADRDHALLSASSAHRWINCTPAPYLEAQHPDTTSEAAAEGTEAHELAEHKLRQHIPIPTSWKPGEFYDEDMEDYTDDYVDHVTAELARTKEADPAAFLAIEQRLDFSHIVPDGFGTGDALIVGDGTMTVVDFKYGKGVEVSAEGNPQMRLYALGALATYGMIYQIEQVRTVIFQPRLGNISVEEITVDELTTWAEQVVRPAAEKAAAGEGQLQAGDWCQFCRHAPQCPALAKHYLDDLPTQPGAGEPPAPDTLSDEQIATIVAHSGELKKWLGKVEDHALAQATAGHHYTGLKVVEGRSVRKYTDEAAVAQAVQQETSEDPYQPRKVLGITAMTKLLGKKRFDELLGQLIHKPEGKPTLVPDSDKRPPMALATPETVFKPIKKGA